MTAGKYRRIGLWLMTLVLLSSLLITTAGGPVLAQTAGQGSYPPPVQPTPMSDQGTQMADGTSTALDKQTLKAVDKPKDKLTKLERISKGTGVSVADLEKMDQAALRQLVEDNIDKFPGSSVLKIEKDKDGKDKVKVITSKNKKDPVAEVTPEPVLPPPTDPYPAPQSNTMVTSPVAQQISTDTTAVSAKSAGVKLASLTRPSALLQSGGGTTIYLPSIMKSDPEAAVIKATMAEIYKFAVARYSDNGTYAYEKEYAGCPLNVKINASITFPYRMMGDYNIIQDHVVGKVTWSWSGYDFDYEEVTFEISNGGNYSYGEPNANCDTLYDADGRVWYHVAKNSWTGGDTYTTDLYLGDTLALQNVRGQANGADVWFDAGYGGGLSTFRYTYRHATFDARWFFDYYTDPYKVQQLVNSLNQYGFQYDVYAPLFGHGVGWPIDYFFNADQAYHDCNYSWLGLYSTIPRGYNPYRYPYESKVCASSVAAYITLSREDYLVPALQAIHVLNTYNNPDFSYTDPANPYGTVTPRSIARRLEPLWNGYGIPAFGKDASYASGIRTDAFLALESIIGYKWGDSTSKYYADLAYNSVKKTIWGVNNYAKYHGNTLNEGDLLRPNYQGSQMLGWREQSPIGYGLPDPGITGQLLDIINMPAETQAITPSNAESTFAAWGALRYYLLYKCGEANFR